MIHFDPESHTYWHNGAKVPGVTSIIKELKDFSMVPPAMLAAAAARGTYVHTACEFYDQDDLDIESLDPDFRGYVEGWIRFRKETGFTPRLIEHRLFHPLHIYAGTMDREGDFEDEPAILDIKTSSGTLTAEVGIQLAAYQEAYIAQHPGNPRPTRRIAVQLREDGTYRLYQYRDQSDFAVFLSLLTVQRWKEKYL